MQGSTLRELRHIQIGKMTLEFGDVHEVLAIDDDTLLIVDSLHQLVALTDWSGRVSWFFGGPTMSGALEDPHQSIFLSDRKLLIVDPAIGLISVDMSDKRSKVIDSIRMADGSGRRRIEPRAAVIGNGFWIVSDSEYEESRLLLLDEATQYGYMVSAVEASDRSSVNEDLKFHNPRWLVWDQAGRLVLTDHDSHRVMIFEPDQS